MVAMKLSILQWNIWYLEDIKNVASFLQQNKADIICLQELTIDHPKQTVADTPAYVAEQLGYHYFHKELPIEGTDGNKYMIANGIFSRYPIVDSHFVYVNEPQADGGYADEYRAYVEVTLDVNGKEVTVGTVHLSYTHHFEPTANKQQESDRLVAELRKHTENFIFTGDLNALPDSYTIDAIAAILQSAGPSFSEKTWTTKPFTYGGFEANTLDWRLDYIFASKDLEVNTTQILTTDYSDHLPVQVSVNIK